LRRECISMGARRTGLPREEAGPFSGGLRGAPAQELTAFFGSCEELLVEFAGLDGLDQGIDDAGESL
jgi:hypothetical protein